MPFLAEEHIDIPTTDLLSWMFDKQTYDVDKPVMMMLELAVANTDHARFMSTLLNQRDRYPQDRREV